MGILQTSVALRQIARQTLGPLLLFVRSGTAGGYRVTAGRLPDLHKSGTLLSARPGFPNHVVLYKLDAQKRKPPLALASAFPAHTGADLWQAVGDVDLGRQGVPAGAKLAA
jgi:hypothetical protein